MGISTVLKKIQLPHESRWINEDVRPVETERRTWGFLTFHNFWLLINCTIATYLTGSSLIPLGLTWWQAIISIVVGNLLATLAIIASSLAGAYYHIGFPVFSRAVWGLWGSQFVIWNRIFLGIGYGFQSWVGGQCIYLILLSWDPTLATDIPNTLPASTGTTTAEFVCYVIFCVLSLPALWIRVHRIQNFFYFSSVVTLVFFLVILIWALATMGPEGFGDTLSNASAVPATGGPNSTAWLMLYGVMSTIGSIAAGILNQNDFSRLATKPGDAIWGQVFAFPFYSIVGSVIGILVTAATQNRLGGEAVWNPPTLFVAILEKDPTSGTRAAVFFAGLALSISQLGANLPGNALPGGLDLASVFPQFINIRRGAYIIALLSPIVNPWRLVNTATTFLTVLSGYGVFLAPMTGLMAAHYLIVCRQKVNVDDLYTGDRKSIYWYTAGVNWRAPIA
ncbi:permease for cytosine/purines, uracil, thiamine, allantoin-domain-containing protein, partial [Aspergillus pseudoustus]